MKHLKKIPIVVAFAGLALAGCGGEGTRSNINSMANNIGRKSMIEKYPKVPNEELIREPAGNRLYSELQNRYMQQLVALKAETEKDGAKMIVVIMSPEVGKFATNANIYGVPFITQACNNQGIDCIDITPDISEWTAVNDPSRIPIGSNWSKDGASFVADMFGSVVTKYEDYRTTHTYPADQRPATFGDAKNLNEEDDEGTSAGRGNAEGKKSPYRFTVNEQGLRMSHELKFPKTRQRVLFLGDSRIFNPFLDDPYIITERLQKKFPDKEMVNAGNLSYTMDDYLSLYREKARYCEPDIVIVCTNGGDILDEYFSHRNRFSRTGKCYRPTELEKQFYNKATGR